MSSRSIFSVGMYLLFFYLPSLGAQAGLKAGPSVSDIGFRENGQTPYLGYEAGMMVHRVPMPAFQAGIFYTLGLGKRFAFQPELLFITQGLDYSTAFLYDDVTYKVKIHYCHVPLLLKYRVSLKRKWRPFLFGGPYASKKLKAIRIIKIEGQKEKAMMPNVKNTDLGLIAGFAAEFELPAGEVTVGLRTSYSLVNMMDRVEGYIRDYYEGPENPYARNINIALLVGYRLKATKEKK
ncbi:MAG: PorT family protein [Lewinellaceae bacterium]|nr:PorT family protein [Lewinellaceae bacterium]